MVVLSGRGGEIKIGYQVVAKLGTWTLRDNLLTSEGVEVDAYWMAQTGSKMLRIPVGATTWVWRDVDASVADTSLFVRVSGSPEQR